LLDSLLQEMTMGKKDKKGKKSLSVPTKEVNEVEIKPREEVLKVEDQPLVEGEKKKKKKKAKKGNKENAEWSKHTTINPDAVEEPVVKEDKPKSAPTKEVKTIKKQKIDDCVKAFSQLIAVKAKDAENSLFEDGPKKIYLQVAAIKLAADADKYTLKARMANNPNVPDSDVLLIVKDIERGIKADHEATLLHYKSLLEKAGVDNVAEVMPMRQLRVEYKEFEAKRNLCNRFDKVLVDDRIIRLIPQFLGAPFYRKNMMPVQVCLTKKDLKQEITRCINTTLMPLSNQGADSTIHIGHTLMKSKELSDNCETAIRAMEERYPGGWVNVRAVHVRVGNVSLPLYVTDRKTSEVGKVQTVNANRNKRPTVVDELSTIPGATVSVNIAGGVKVKRVADPEWDAKIEGPLGPSGLKKSKPSDRAGKAPANDTEDSQDTGEVEDKPPRKETKKEKKAAAAAAAEEGKKKQKEKKKVDPEESEDDLDDMEEEYMRKVAEEEEEIERREKENMEKMGIPATQDEEEEDEDEDDLDEDEDAESLADDDVEAENLLSDDEQDDGGEDLIMNRPEEEEEDEGEREEHLKKKNKNKKDLKKQKTAQKEGKKNKKGKKSDEKKGKDSNKVKAGKIQKKKKY